MVREAPYSLWLNGALLERAPASPGGWEDLALGRLYTAGLLSWNGRRPLPQRRGGRHAPGGGGGAAHTQAFAPSPASRGSRRFSWRPQGRFLEGSPLFRSTGGVHSALLAWPGGQCRREDIGRHNAVNKAVGGALRMGAPMGESVLYTSGRLPLSVAGAGYPGGYPCGGLRAAPTERRCAARRPMGPHHHRLCTPRPHEPLHLPGHSP